MNKALAVTNWQAPLRYDWKNCSELRQDWNFVSVSEKEIYHWSLRESRAGRMFSSPLLQALILTVSNDHRPLFMIIQNSIEFESMKEYQTWCTALHIHSLTHICSAGPARSVGCAIRLVFRRSQVRSSGQAQSFVEIWSWNNFYGHSLPTADSSKAVVSYWRKYGQYLLSAKEACSGTVWIG